MAEKILQTRIINKHALLTEWESSNLALKEGEIALAKVMVAQKDGTEAPTYIAKVGIEGKKFSECPMFFAPASDVYSWAKAATKPTYGASEIATAAGASVEAEITNIKTAIGGSGSVSSQIDTKITAALDLLDLETVTLGTGKIIETITQENGKVTVTTRDIAKEDIPTIEISQVNGLQDALDAKAVKATVDQEFTSIKTRLDSGDIHTGIVTAQTAADNAQTYAEGVNTALETYKTNNDSALADVKETAEAATTVEEAGTIAQGKVDAFNTSTIVPLAQRVTNAETAIATEKSRAEGVESGLDTRLTAAEGAIQSLNAATTFAGTGTYAEMNALENIKAGAIFVVIDTTDTGKQYNNKEFVYDGSKWVELGDTTAELSEINSLKQRVTNIESDLGEDGDTTKAIAAAQADATQALADAATANDAIAVINGDGVGSIAKAVADATDTLKKYAEDEADAAESAAKSYTDGEVDKLEQADVALGSKIDTHIADKDNPHEVTKAQVGLGNVDNKSVAEIKTEFTGAVAESNDGFVTGGAVYSAVEAAKTAASGYTDQEVGKVDQKVTNNATDITTIKNNYARVSGDHLVYGQGDAEMVIVFDCGGAE